MVAGRYPKDESSRRNRSAPAFDWVLLPAEGRQGPPPPLPDKSREWQSATQAAWADLWSSPQATMWDQSGRTLHRWAFLHHRLVCDDDLDANQSKAASLSAEMRQIEDRHGLTPKALLQLRWKIAEPVARADAPSASVTRLRAVVEGEPVPVEPVAPARRAAKLVWVEWAVSCGASRVVAEAMTKAELVEVYAGLTPSADRAAGTPAAALLRDRMGKPGRD